MSVVCLEVTTETTELIDTQSPTLFTMASKAFGNGLKELRFLFCQTSEHSAATRYATTKWEDTRLKCGATQEQEGAYLKVLG